MSDGSSSGMKWGCLGIAGALVAAFIFIPIALSAISTNPHEWVREHYTHVSGDDPDDEPVIYSSPDDTTTVVAAVVSGTDPDDVRRGGGPAASADGPSPTGADPGDITYLRYDDDWILAIYPGDAGTRIEVTEFDEGRRRYGGFLAAAFFFRGGGSGFGK